MSNILNIGVQSLSAYQTAMEITGQNLGNVGNDNYTRRQVSLIEAANNNGVNIGDIRRVYDSSVNRYLQQQTSFFGKSDVLRDQLATLESLLDDNTNSIGTYLNTALVALRNLNTNAGDEKGRSLYLQQLSILSNRFEAINGQFQLSLGSVNESMSNMTLTVNQLTEKISNLNLQLSQSSNADNASLLDQRESLLRDLSQYIDFTTQADSTGSVNIIIGNGTLLVFGIQSFDIGTVPGQSDPSVTDLVVNNGTSNIKITDAIKGGQMGGLITYRNESLLPAQRALDRLSLSVMDEMNQQNALGIDLYGNLGGNIFQNINAIDMANARAIAFLGNTGSEQISVNIDNTKELTTSDYMLTFDTATTYVLSRKSDNAIVSTGSVATIPAAITADGFTININSGTIAAGDHYTISPTKNAANNMTVIMSDPKQLALAWPVTAISSQANTGAGKIEVSSVYDTGNSIFSTPGQLNPPLLIRFLSSSSYEVVDATTNAVIQTAIPYDSSSGTGTIVFPTPAPTNFDPGFTVKLSGEMAAGDEFQLNYNSTNTADNRNGLAMENLYQAATIAGGLTFGTAFHAFTIDVSTTTNRAQIDLESSKVLLKSAREMFGSVSGVNSVEELVGLTRYQQAYQASAQIIQVAKSLFETVIGVTRG
jgi:flagellar hook-associated protein 1 FlgK